MPVFTFRFYAIDPITVFNQTVGGTTIYSGPATADGVATVTDNGGGLAETVLEDDNAGENATVDATLGGLSSTGSSLDAEEVWTLRDTVTGEQFELVSFDIENGGAAGIYTLSEVPLVPGRSYETLAYDSFPDVDAGDPAFTYDDYISPTPNGVVEGTSGDDVIDASYTGDPDRDLVDANDAPAATPPTALAFTWSDFADGVDLSGGVTQTVGGVQVDVGYTGAVGGSFTSDQTGTKYSQGLEPFSGTSSAFLFQDGSPENAAVTFDFSATAGSGNEDAVQGLQFRINDIDGVINGANNFQDVVTVTALDVDGNPAQVSITAAAEDTLNGQTVTGAISSNSETQAAGSALVEIQGPVSQVVITYDNGGDTQQAIYLSDLHFLSVPQGVNNDVIAAGGGDDLVDAGAGDDSVTGDSGNDTLTGAEGADTLDGGSGNDQLNIGSGDIASGGDGDDRFVIDPGALGGGVISVTGGEGVETGGDSLDFAGQLAPGSVTITNPGEPGGKSGTATLVDGTQVNFTEIERIICFADGTMIDTPRGPYPIEQLAPGDLVLTLENGPIPIRWHGRRVVVGHGDAAPIRFGPGTLGNARPLLVSPQHRILVTDHRAQLNFGEDEILVPAKALIDGRGVFPSPVERIAYHHILFDTHQIIWANGVPTESYHPGAYSLDGLGEEARDALFSVFPNLRSDPNGYGPSARPAVRVEAGRILAA